MLLDDRLATVLRADTGGERAARTQYRQLLDLLGSAKADDAEGLTPQRYRQLAEQFDALSDAERERTLLRPALESRNHTLLTFLAYQRLNALDARIPAEERAHILREPGLRLRNSQLVAFLAEGDAKPAASALATARLTEQEWQDLIPRLPIVARGFLRHRRDLPSGARAVLAQLGVRDLVLPQPAGDIADRATPQQDAQPSAPAPAAGIENGDGIRALLRRIEAFREGRRTASPAPRLPLGDTPDDLGDSTLESFEFTSDPQGRIDWANAEIAPLVVGMRLGRAGPGVIAALDENGSAAMRSFQPLRGTPLAIDAHPAISGDWRIDAEPAFGAAGGHFSGYRGRIRRPVLAPSTGGTTADTPADRMRQLLHELRTPVNAIQGFAELIQQQLFGPAPNEYRALAAAVAVDAAKLLASFDEIDRLARLETGAMELDEGEGDLREAVASTIQRLEGALRPRGAGFDLTVSGSPFITALAREELMLLVWRILASMAGMLAPGERTSVELASAPEGPISLNIALPAALAEVEDKFSNPVSERRPALSAGMFGTGFAFRLARAEVQAGGGTFEFSGDSLLVNVPPLTASAVPHSSIQRDGNAA